MHFVPDVDFSFQSSIEGGHQLVGGIVADFVFPFLMVILNPLGPTHDQYIRIRKDEEQNLSLEALGYTVYMIPEDIIKDEIRFDEYMLRIFGWLHSGGPNEGQSLDEPTALPGYSSVAVFNGIQTLSELQWEM
jgi:hypothetical protein